MAAPLQGAIAGIVVGSVAFIAIVILIILLLLRRSRPSLFIFNHRGIDDDMRVN